MRKLRLFQPQFFWLWRSCLIGCGLWLLAACAASPVPAPAGATVTRPPTDGPTPSVQAATVTPSPVPTTAIPSPTPTATPIPTTDPTRLLASAEAAFAQLEARAGDASLVCFRHQDLDADGQPEWVALTHRGVDPARLEAFVLDASTFYPLAPAYPEAGEPDVGLGEYPVCEIEIRDVNVDGVPEIAVFGHARENETLLHLFAWDGATYVRLGRFAGDAGVRFADADGDAEEEIEVGYRVRGARDLAWFVVHTWEEGTYGWTSDYYDWYFTARPHTYPDHQPDYAVIAYYLALDDRDLPGAYALLDPATRQAYETWAPGYATTVQVRAGGVHTVPGTETAASAQVTAMVTAWDNDQGVIIGRQWNVTWTVVASEGGWRLRSAEAEPLQEWDATLWP